MKLCEYNCAPCCDFCKFVIADIEDNSPVGCKLHPDEEHQEIADACGYCDDFVCMNAEDKI